MESADTYDEPPLPGDGRRDPSPPDPEASHNIHRHVLDGLFEGTDSSKDAVLSFITTGLIPKDGDGPLRELLISLSTLPPLEKEYINSNEVAASTLSSSHSNHTPKDHKGDKHDKDEKAHTGHKDHQDQDTQTKSGLNKTTQSAPLPSPSILPKPSSPAITSPVLPPTPQPDDHPAQDLFEALGEKPEVRRFLLAILASNKVPLQKVKQLFNISTIAANQDFATLMDDLTKYGGNWAGHPYLTGALNFGVPHAAALLQQPESPQQASQDHQQRPYHAPWSYQQTAQPQPHAYQSSIVPADLTPYLPMGPHVDQQTFTGPSTATAHHQQPLPVSDAYSLVPREPPAPSAPLATSTQTFDLATTANFERQTGLPSPSTQGSSGQSDGCATPTGHTNTASGADLLEVVCPLHLPDGKPCAKRCHGARRYRSIQEHIRRAHPSRWIPTLPATEASFRMMVDTDGVVCPFLNKDNSTCGHRSTGTRPYRTIQDHIKALHPEHFIPDLPGNESSFRRMVENAAFVLCPLETEDGTRCTKRCFGDKRWRSMQEHIRRSHPNNYIRGLHATEESFRQMTGQADGAVPPALPPFAVNDHSMTSGVVARRSSREDVSLSDPRSPVAKPLEKPAVAANSADVQQPFAPQIWPAPAHETEATVAPSLLTMVDAEQSNYDLAMPSFQTLPLPAQPAFKAYAHATMHQQRILGLTSDPTLTRDLFAPKQLPGDTAAYQHSYGALPVEANVSLAYGIDTRNSSLPPAKRKLDGITGADGGGQGRPAKKASMRWDVQTCIARSSNPPFTASEGPRHLQTEPFGAAATETPPRPKATQKKAVSPFFQSSTTKQNGQGSGTNAGPSTGPKTCKRPARGTVSSLPIPPLSNETFGLIQETLAHEPFRLLVATAFLQRTQAKAALPVFEQLMEKWQTPAELAAASPQLIKGLIEKLGLAEIRCDTIQKYAQSWVQNPPSKNVRYGVKDYPRKGDGQDVRAGEEFGPEDQRADVIVVGLSQQNRQPEADVQTKARGHGTSWEIGHLTSGAYTIDSWRIFCRDVLLGRAEDWKGKGREPTFQPEWMRVLPQDKELRACLRWMWMKEGWLWDPQTGEKTVLNEEMRTAVNEGRVGYDNNGNLCITQAGAGVAAGTGFVSG